MALSEAPEQTLMKFLKSKWDQSLMGFCPIFSTGWYNAEMDEPQVTVSPGAVSPRYFVIDSKQREFSELLEVNVWTQDESDRFLMVHHLDEIVQLYRLSPGTGLSDMETSSWHPLDEPDKGPLFRSRLFVRLRYYKTSNA